MFTIEQKKGGIGEKSLASRPSVDSYLPLPCEVLIIFNLLWSSLPPQVAKQSLNIVPLKTSPSLSFSEMQTQLMLTQVTSAKDINQASHSSLRRG